MLGARIAALRRQAGLNQAELASRLGISPSAVGMYEQGRREPSVDMIIRLSKFFQVSTDYLLTGGTPEPGEQNTLDELVRRQIDGADRRLELRRERPFTRQELAVLFAAMLMEG